MKKYMFIFISLFILFIGIKVEALSSVSLTTKSVPEATESGNYITLSLNVLGKQSSTSSVVITFSYDTEYLQLVGFEPGNGNCSYSNNEITCSEDGTSLVYPVFKIKKTFTSNQTINVVASETVAAESASSKVTINKKEKIIEVSSITLDSYKNTLSIGDTSQLSVTVYPDNANDKTVTFTSSDNNIITVSETGLVTATGEGDAYVIIRSGNVEKSATFTVMKDPIELKEIKIKEKEMKLKVGDKKKIVYTLDPFDATVKDEDIIIKSSDDNVVIIDKDLNIHAMGEGDATITISAGLVKTEISVNVTGTKTKSNGSSPIVPCIITSILTFFFTVLILFIVKHKKDSSDEVQSPSVNENGDFKFDM